MLKDFTEVEERNTRHETRRSENQSISPQSTVDIGANV